MEERSDQGRNVTGIQELIMQHLEMHKYSNGQEVCAGKCIALMINLILSND